MAFLLGCGQGLVAHLFMPVPSGQRGEWGLAAGVWVWYGGLEGVARRVPDGMGDGECPCRDMLHCPSL